MGSTLLRGHILYPDGPRPGEIMIRDGVISDVTDRGYHEIGDFDIFEGLIIPGLLDAHTHLGDHLARGDLPHDLSEVVLPGGLKHSFLTGSERTDLVRSVSNSLGELRPGVTTVIDYREGGSAGIDILEEARRGSSVDILTMARPSEGDDPGELLNRASGFGIPSLSTENIHGLREIAFKRGALFSVHASEMYREDLNLITSLHPDQVVHMINGTPSDWETLADLNIPVSVCPRSNLSYSLPIQLQKMYESGLKLTLGTDNSISVRQDMFREMETAWILMRRGKMSGEEAARNVFKMAAGGTIEGTDLMKRISSGVKWGRDGWPAVGTRPYLSVLKYPESDRWVKDPFSFIVRFCTQSDVLFTGP